MQDPDPFFYGLPQDNKGIAATGQSRPGEVHNMELPNGDFDIMMRRKYSSSDHHTSEGAGAGHERGTGTLDASSKYHLRSEISEFKLDQTYLLCVDPTDKLPFQINMGNRTVIEDQHHEEVTRSLKGKIERHIFLLRELLDEIGEQELSRISPWAIKPSPLSEYFRRCMVQSYNLEQESQHYQRYIDKSDLSENLGQNYKQDIKVFIIEGLERFDRRAQRNMDESAMDLGRSKTYKLRTNTVLHRDIDLNGYFILNRISLLQTADQVIDMISTKLEKEMHLHIDSARYAYILKFRNCDSYLYGPDQLVYFQDIRDALKYQQKIEVVVMVIDHSSVDSHFPPLLNYKEDLRVEEERIQSQIRQIQGASQQIKGSTNVMGVADQGIFGNGSDSGEHLSHGGGLHGAAGEKCRINPDAYQMAQRQQHQYSINNKRRSSILTELFRQREKVVRMEVFDFKMLKYKKSSVFFWYKPNSATHKGEISAMSSDGPGTQGASNGCKYPSLEDRFHSLRWAETTGDIQEHFKVSIKAVKNIGNILKRFREKGPIKVQKIEYRDTTTKSRLKRVSPGALLRKEHSPTKKPSSAAEKPVDSPSLVKLTTKVSQADFLVTPFVHRSDVDEEDLHKGKLPKTFSINPRYVQFQGVILLGSKCISTFSLSPLIDFNSIEKCDAKLTFFKDQKKSRELDTGKKSKKKKELLKICEIPSFARLCLNVILVEETTLRDRMRSNRTGYILGSVSCSIFDVQRQLRFGRLDFKVWPFEAFHARLVCQSECNTYERQRKDDFNDYDNLLLDIGFDTKSNVQWGIKQEYFLAREEAGEFEEREEDDFKKFLEVESEHLNKVKQMIDHYPEEDKDPALYEPGLLFKYRDYVDVIPAFIKAVNFGDPSQVAQCYKFLESNEKARNLKPEEALALLDSQFGDEFVRIYALQRLSKLDDYILALYMPQLVQALKYELHHDSVLSAFLLERAIKNTSVIGHAFYWSIKASMHSKMSFERYYLVLERFLMCCGSFKFRLYNESIVTRALMDVSQSIQDDFWLVEGVKRNKDFNEEQEREKMNRLLVAKEREIKLRLNLVCTRAKYDVEPDEPTLAPDAPPPLNGTRMRSASVMSKGPRFFKFEQQQSNSSQNVLNAGSYIFSVEEVEHIMKTILRGDGEPGKTSRFLIKGQPELKEEEWMEEVFYFPIEPRKPIKGFDQSSGFFVSKKIPLRIVARLSEDKIHQKQQRETLQRSSRNLLMPSRQSANIAAKPKPTLPPPLSANKIKVMFKYGDDLRQDNLVLQFFKLMDRLWMQNGLNLEMNAYNVIETGNKIGFIEFVDNAEEISSIHKKYGNFQGPFLETSILQYVEGLWANEEDRKKMTVSRREYHTNFIKSTAGQCAATYVLGIGDRHTGNYMLQKYTGRFFHIDFGHFLGHFKKKFGIRRDVEPFIFSREMCHFIVHFNPDVQLATAITENPGNQSEMSISAPDQSIIKYEDDPLKGGGKTSVRGDMKKSSRRGEGTPSKERQNSGGPKGKKDVVRKSFQCFNRQKALPGSKESDHDQEKQKQDLAVKFFEDQGSQAYNILRKNAHTLINLATLMIAGDIVQLNEQSMRFLIDRLKLSKTDEEASADFKNQIQVATHAWVRRVDSVFHNIMDELKKGNKKKQQTALTTQTVNTEQSHNSVDKVVIRKPLRSPPASSQLKKL